jgi:hypothetical protein
VFVAKLYTASLKTWIEEEGRVVLDRRLPKYNFIIYFSSEKKEIKRLHNGKTVSMFNCAFIKIFFFSWWFVNVLQECVLLWLFLYLVSLLHIMGAFV